MATMILAIVVGFVMIWAFSHLRKDDEWRKHDRIYVAILLGGVIYTVAAITVTLWVFLELNFYLSLFLSIMATTIVGYTIPQKIRVARQRRMDKLEYQILKNIGEYEYEEKVAQCGNNVVYLDEWKRAHGK